MMKKLIKVLIFLSLFLFSAKGAILAVSPTPSATPSTQVCNFVQEAQKAACQACLSGKEGSWTVFGCLSNNPSGFVNFILKLAIGVGGGIAFLSILWGSFNIITSSGDPNKLNMGKEMVFYSVIGLLLIIFSVVILKIIGVDILGIPGFKQ